MKTVTGPQFCKGRASPYKVTHYVDRAPVRRYFKSKTEAQQYKKRLKAALSAGVDVKILTLVLRTVTNSGYDLRAVIEAGIAQLSQLKSPAAMLTATFAEGAALFQKRQRDQKRTKGTIATTAWILKGACAAFGESLGSALSDTTVQAYIDKLPNRKGHVGKASYDTKKDVLRDVRGALRMLGIQNPLPKVSITREVHEVEFFSVDECRQMLGRVSPEYKGVVALLLFAAVRPSIVSRLENVDVKTRRIFMPKTITKSKRNATLRGEFRRSDGAIIPGLPNVLWQWLERYPFKRCSWRNLQEQLREIIGRWVQDGTRHTGATFFFHLYGEEETRKILTHESRRLVLENYVGTSSAEDADAFYSLTPDAVPDLFEASPNRKSVIWPSDDELKRRVWEQSTEQIARALGVSGVAVAKHCKKRGIARPGRGHWMRAATQTDGQAA